jgi:hypothetical protein
MADHASLILNLQTESALFLQAAEQGAFELGASAGQPRKDCK